MDSSTGLTQFNVAPADGSTAPQNTHIWLPQANATWGEIQPAEVVIRHRGEEIPSSVTEILVEGGSRDATLWVFEPDDLLSAGSTVEIVVREEVISRFRVSAGVWEGRPEPPTIAKVSAMSEYFGGCFCGSYSRVDVEVKDEADIVLVGPAGQPLDGLPRSALAVGTGRGATAQNLPEGKHRLQVSVIDLAGNMSAPTVLPAVTVPPRTSGCSIEGEAGLTSLFLFVLGGMTLRLRRPIRIGFRGLRADAR